MPPDKYETITGVVVIATIFLLISFFILALLIFINHRKRTFVQEKQKLQDSFSKTLLQSQLEIQEQTFNDISQEIHDNVGQILSLAKVQINIMNETENISREMLNEVKENIGKAMSDLRDIAKSLSTDRIRSLTIQAAVAIEAERVAKSGVAIVNIESDGTERALADHKKLILFRIIQESLQNCIKHANATNINIQVFYLPDQVCIQINDNGKGFSVEEMMLESNGLGLANIKSRAVLAGGTSSVESRLNLGTTIKIYMPYE